MSTCVIYSLNVKMLCDTCQRHQNCLPVRLAYQDDRAQALLHRLHTCERYQEQGDQRQTPAGLWSTLRHWSHQFCPKGAVEKGT